MTRRITFSRNFTLSLSRTCSCYCKYCAFATHQPHIYPPDEVSSILQLTGRRSVKELLILTGDDPAYHPGVAKKLASFGFDGFCDYVVWVCEQALQRGLLPHTNLGVLTEAELAKLRTVTASQGLMLESINPKLVAHQGSANKDPAKRLKCIEDAGRLKIPFTTGILVGIGETEGERMEALAAIASIHNKFGHIQEVIVQNFVPHQSYYGQEPADIADAAARSYWHTGICDGPSQTLPDWACAITIEDMKKLVSETRSLLPGVGIQVPPNLSDWWPELIQAGATDLGGLSANGDHISPEHPFPSPSLVRKRLREDEVAIAERLCVYRNYISPEWQSEKVLGVIRERYPLFMDSSHRGNIVKNGHTSLIDNALCKGVEGKWLTQPELTTLFSERDPQIIEEIRMAADELRHKLVGDTVTYVVNRNINVSNMCVVGCAFCGFGKGARSPEVYELDRDNFAARVQEASDYGATEICIQSGINPAWRLADYTGWLQLAKDVAPDIHLHAYSPMEIAHICDVENLQPKTVFERLIEAGLDSTPGTAAEVLEDGVRSRISPNKLPVARWVEIIEAAHSSGLKSTATVMFGHIENASELAEHMRVIRELQERTGGITEFVPLSFIPFHTLLGRKHGIQEISKEENLKHTAVFRLALGTAVKNVQASWVKMGLDAATESLSWGVNDLGGTLMEESISRMAGSYHGVRVDPADLVAAAESAGRPAVERTTLYGHPKDAALDSTTSENHLCESRLEESIARSHLAKVI